MGARVMVVVGTRPEAIKMAPVVAALEAIDGLDVALTLTGQHTDMVDQVLGAFSLEATHDLAIMRDGQTLYDVVHRALDGLRDTIRSYRPDVLLVQGDTATVFTGSLAAFFERVKVGHVEAGLRSHDKWSPFPEEIFRRLTDVLSDYYFAPTVRARDALLAEGVPAERVFVTGNTVVDALLQVSGEGVAVASPGMAGASGAPSGRVAGGGDVRATDETVRAVLGAAGRVALLTAHRRESFGAPLEEVLGAVRAVADEHADLHVLYPVHPNPNVHEPAHRLLSDHPRIHLTTPLDYLDLVAVLRSADLVLTDSGGIQEEAPTFGVPVLVLRDVTERPEGIEAGVAELVGTDHDVIVERSRAALGRSRGVAPKNPYGDGAAGARIADVLAADLLGRPRTTKDWR